MRPFFQKLARVVLMQSIKMLIDEVMMDSFGQTFIQLKSLSGTTQCIVFEKQL